MPSPPNNVVAIYGGNIPTEQLFSLAAEHDFETVMVVGILKEPDERDGRRFWLSTSHDQFEKITYALQRALATALDHARAYDP